MKEMENLRCLSQSHCKSLQRGSEVRVKEGMVKKKADINIALSQARLRCENGLQFVRQKYCQAISLSPSGKLSATQTDTHTQGKRKNFLSQQIIKLQLHGAAFVMCFPMLWVIIPDWRILKHLHSLGHSAVKIIGETLINLPWNQQKSEQNKSNVSRITA